MNAEQREILTNLVHHCETSGQDATRDYLKTIYYRINDPLIYGIAVTMLYHEIAPRPLPDDACDDDGEHCEIMLSQAIYLLEEADHE